MNMKKTVVIVSHGVDPAELKKGLKGDYSFISFVDNYEDRKKWESSLRPRYRKLGLKTRIETCKNDMRNEFLDFVDRLGRDGDALWPLFPFSEQNTFVSNLFLDCVRLKILGDLIAEIEENLIIIVEDPFLFEAIREVAVKANVRVVTKRDLLFYTKRLKTYVTPCFHLIKFLFTSLRHRQASRVLRKRTNGEKETPGFILHTWIDDGSFTKEGQYRDRYFGSLLPWLKAKGYPLYIVPFIFNTRKPLKKVYTLLEASGSNFLPPYRYYRPTDYLRCAGRALKILSFTRWTFHFSGIDVAILVKRDTFSRLGGFLPFFMYLDLFKRLKQHGYEFTGAIDVFEGMIPERAWIMGFSQTYPGRVTIGYQHTLFSRDLLCYFVYRGDSLQRVLPERIVCTGEMVKEFLIREGLPANRLVAGCALRYEYLWKKREIPSPESGVPRDEGKSVLITLPLQLSGAEELLTVMAKMAKKRKDLKFYIKPHPMMNKVTLEELLKAADWPENELTIAEGTMEEWTERVNLLVSTASAAVVDALIAGKPVLIVGREEVLDLNPLDWIDSPYAATYRGEEEIEKRIDLLLRLEGEDLEALHAFGEKILLGCFKAVTEENLSPFLP